MYVDGSDAALATGRRYYRLCQKDLNGTLSYSPVVTVSRAAAGASTASKFDAYSNPFADRLAVALPGQSETQATTVTLLSLTGRPVFSTKLDLNAAPQALNSLPELPACLSFPPACTSCAWPRPSAPAARKWCASNRRPPKRNGPGFHVWWKPGPLRFG